MTLRLSFILVIAMLIAIGGSSAAAAPIGESMSLITVNTQGEPASCELSGCNRSPSISESGRYVVFTSGAEELTTNCTTHGRKVYLRDTLTHETICIADDGEAKISADGSVVMLVSDVSFTGADGTLFDGGIYLYDVSSGVYTQHNFDPQGDPTDFACCLWSVSSNGDWLAYERAFGIISVRDVNAEATYEIPAMNGETGNSDTQGISISNSGRYVAFASEATNYVPGLAGEHTEILVHDRVTGETEVISQGLSGSGSDGGSYTPMLTDNARYVLFTSDAENLVDNDSNDRRDLFRYDRDLQQMELMSVRTGGEPTFEGIFNWASMTTDGRFVAFSSSERLIDPLASNGYNNIFVHDTLTKRTALASRAIYQQATNESSYEMALSGSGRVAFTSSASNLVDEGFLGQPQHIYLYQFPDSDGDGHLDPFDLCPDDVDPGTQEDPDNDGVGTGCDNCPTIANPDQANSDDAGPGDACETDDDGDGVDDAGDNCPQVGNSDQADSDGDTTGDACDNCPTDFNDDQADSNFDAVGDACTPSNLIERVSVANDGSESDGRSINADVSADGRYVAFTSNATNLVPILAGNPCLIELNDGSVQACNEIYLRDRLAGTTERLRLSGTDEPLDAGAALIDMTPDARFIAFWSTAESLGIPQYPFGTLPGVFLFDRQTGITERLDIKANGTPSTEYASDASISDDGRFVTLGTRGALIPSDDNGQQDVYLRDRLHQTTTAVTAGPGVASWPGASSGPISGDGSTIIFVGDEAEFVEDLPDHYVANLIVQDRESGTNSVLPLKKGSPGISGGSPTVSETGEVVTFYAYIDYGTGPEQQIVQYDRTTEEYSVISVNSLGERGTTNSYASISAGGEVVAFSSTATNLIEADTNNCQDVFVHQVETSITSRANVSAGGLEADHTAELPKVSAMGTVVIFQSSARTLVPEDDNGQSDIFLIHVTEDGGAADSSSLTEAAGTPNEPAYCGPPPGDFDCDGEPTPIDALLLLRWLARLKPYGECQTLANPMSCFEELSPVHSLIILRYAAGLIESVGGCGGK